MFIAYLWSTVSALHNFHLPIFLCDQLMDMGLIGEYSGKTDLIIVVSSYRKKVVLNKLFPA